MYKGREFIAKINLGNEMSIQKRLDLSNLKKGKYKVVLNDLFMEHTYVVSM
jgi:hypothetical protein